MNVIPKYTVVSKGMIKFLGLFIPIFKESREMLYQYDRDYVFCSDKFEKEYIFKFTPYEEGIKQIVITDYKK